MNDKHRHQALANLIAIVSVLFVAGLCFVIGRLTAPVPQVETIWTPVADAVTIGHPAEGGGIGIYQAGDLIKVWRPKDGPVYDLFQSISDHPREPERWIKDGGSHPGGPAAQGPDVRDDAALQ